MPKVCLWAHAKVCVWAYAFGLPFKMPWAVFFYRRNLREISRCLFSRASLHRPQNKAVNDDLCVVSDEGADIALKNVLLQKSSASPGSTQQEGVDVLEQTQVWSKSLELQCSAYPLNNTQTQGPLLVARGGLMPVSRQVWL